MIRAVDATWKPYLYHFQIVKTLEGCVKESYLLHDQSINSTWAIYVDLIRYIIRMLDEEEDAGAEELLGGDREDEGE